MNERARPLLLAIVAARAVLAVAAIPLAPFLYERHAAVLVLLRPSKEVLLFAGYLVHRGDLNLLVVVLAAIPLLVLAVWIFYALGRSYADQMDDADLPGIAGRILPRERISKLRDAIGERGWPLIFIGRLAIMPSTLVAAAAGSSEMPPRTFLLADAAGSAATLAMMLILGYALEEARDEAGPWLSVLGAVAMLTVLTLLGRKLRSSSVRREHAKAR